jgi:hypothetical protein
MVWIVGLIAVAACVACGLLLRRVDRRHTVCCQNVEYGTKLHAETVSRILALTAALDEWKRASAIANEDITRATKERVDPLATRIDIAEDAIRALIEHLDTYHGDRKGDRTKPWRNLPQFNPISRRDS